MYLKNVFITLHQVLTKEIGGRNQNNQVQKTLV